MNVAIDNNQGYNVSVGIMSIWKQQKPPKRKVKFHAHSIKHNVRYLKKLLIVEEDFWGSGCSSTNEIFLVPRAVCSMRTAYFISLP